MRSRLPVSLLGLLISSSAAVSAAELRVAAPAGDGMVIQRRAVVPIRGWATEAAEVAVSFGGRTHRTRADDSGRWRIDLPPREAGGPWEMRVVAAGEELTVRDVLVGDVWLCSGQSNMEWPVAFSLDAEAEIAAAGDLAIRHFKVPRSFAEAPAPELAGGLWEPADPEHVGDFTAVGYFFARSLRPHVGTPIGLINSTWGGSRIEAWMSAESLGLDEPEVQAVLERERLRRQELLRAIDERAGGLPREDHGLFDGKALWAAPQLDDSAWHEIPVPSLWEEAGWEGMDGVGWYRTSLQLTAAEAASEVYLGLGAIDDSDTSWVNGRRVGGTEWAWNQERRYRVPEDALVEGRNVIAVRVEDGGGGGGIYGDPASVYLEIAGHRRSLAGTWRFRLGVVTVDPVDRQREVPTMLYNKMMHPLHDFPVRGILWYQGESNAWGADAFAYRRLFGAMIEDWRRKRGDEELPFLFAQLAAFLPPPDEPGESSWAVLRESQSAALELAATAQVVLIDAGDADDVHPRDKRTVGQRLALAARKVAYGEELVFSGPVYTGMRLQGDRVLLGFDHVGGGLVAGGPAGAGLGGFAIAGADRRFVWAEAKIVGDRVAVRSESVPAPVAVRYAWADNPEGANLYNREGLPASPFRTDDWEVAQPSTLNPEY